MEEKVRTLLRWFLLVFLLGGAGWWGWYQWTGNNAQANVMAQEPGTPMLQVPPTPIVETQPPFMQGGRVVIESPRAWQLRKTFAEPLTVERQGLKAQLYALDTRTENNGQVEKLYMVAQVCIELPGPDWSVDEAYLETDQGRLPLEGFSLYRLEIQKQGTRQCTYLYFPWPQQRGANPRVKALVIQTLAQDVPEQPDCAAVNQRLRDRGIETRPASGQGIGGCEVVKKPQDMTLEEAYQQVLQALSARLQGPWRFELP